jgi:hypothetical protein
MWHTIWQSCLKWRTISHMWSIFCSTCVKYALPFFWHMVCQISLKWSQQGIIVKHILHNMCRIRLSGGARFTVYRIVLQYILKIKLTKIITLLLDDGKTLTRQLFWQTFLCECPFNNVFPGYFFTEAKRPPSLHGESMRIDNHANVAVSRGAWFIMPCLGPFPFSLCTKTIYIRVPLNDRVLTRDHFK